MSKTRDDLAYSRSMSASASIDAAAPFGSIMISKLSGLCMPSYYWYCDRGRYESLDPPIRQENVLEQGSIKTFGAYSAARKSVVLFKIDPCCSSLLLVYKLGRIT